MQRRYLLAVASAMTLATSMAASTAHAFDKVWWDWNLDVDTNADVMVDVYLNLDPSGAVISETNQVFHGNQTATARVGNINVDLPRTHYRYPLDAAANLGEVTNVAAALGNSNAITSDFSVQSDVFQSTDGGLECRYFYCHPTAANLIATASVRSVRNATVNNAAQAIANSNSITVDPASSDDALIISNVEQLAYANGSAYASVYGVQISGVTGLGSGDLNLNRVLVTNTAIAAGNVNNITIVNGAIPFPDQNN